MSDCCEFNNNNNCIGTQFIPIYGYIDGYLYVIVIKIRKNIFLPYYFRCLLYGETGVSSNIIFLVKMFLVSYTIL